jgi:hypothetical protein
MDVRTQMRSAGGRAGVAAEKFAAEIEAVRDEQIAVDSDRAIDAEDYFIIRDLVGRRARPTCRANAPPTCSRCRRC